jgi:hypothetical protein
MRRATARAAECCHLHLHVRRFVALGLVQSIGGWARGRGWIEIDECWARMQHCSRNSGAPGVTVHINNQRQSTRSHNLQFTCIGTSVAVSAAQHFNPF